MRYVWKAKRELTMRKNPMMVKSTKTKIDHMYLLT